MAADGFACLLRGRNFCQHFRIAIDDAGEVHHLGEAEDAQDRELLERRIAMQKRRSQIILRGSQLLYIAISFFVGTSLTVAGDAVLGYRIGVLPTALAALGVLAMFAASLLLARESSMAVFAINEEMDHGHVRARRRRPASR